MIIFSGQTLGKKKLGIKRFNQNKLNIFWFIEKSVLISGQNMKVEDLLTIFPYWICCQFISYDFVSRLDLCLVCSFIKNFYKFDSFSFPHDLFIFEFVVIFRIHGDFRILLCLFLVLTRQFFIMVFVF